MESLKIILFAILAAVVYGILHDQVTAHVCVEYFTIGHPPVFATDSPFLLAIGWGVIATWWVGLILGILLALAARVGRAPKLRVNDVRAGIVRLMLVSAGGAAVGGIVGALLAAQGAIWLVGEMAARVPEDRHVAFLTVGFAHSASYAIGILGGLFLAAWTWRRRRRATATRPLAG
ncbi:MULTISPECIES: hypothetical protein [unclassified Sphingomonas]|uniref:hypothetical protein n=1 Tax=unclassified Sphingomonas TaxID=196159 RepID=UPI002150D012|nr:MULTISPECIES: hypothetical protein [unclassified Sphingomonas]MCR5870370.1 hypothetical protein [Sphingomonas sp. J344]UUY01292.1 hypothetical protein LRS08_09820 [Sphingomonas sp. J315]